jgi:DNA-binding response OmpR family regulator
MTGHGDSNRLLLAEDDALLAETVNEFLTQEGFCVVVSLDGQEALEIASKTKIAALLTDLRMPRLDGVALIRRLREKCPELPIVVMTGFAPLDWRSMLQREGEGPLVLLDKPIRLNNLLSALLKVLRTAQPDPYASP